MSKNKYHKIKAEIFKLSILNKIAIVPKNTKRHSLDIRKLKNDELGYFSTLDNL